MSISANVEIEFNTSELASVFDAAWVDASRELEPILTRYARSNHKYKDRTGNLTRSTISNTINKTLSVFSTAGYAKYVESNTNDDWAYNAIDDNISIIETIYNKHLQNHFDKLQ